MSAASTVTTNCAQCLRTDPFGVYFTFELLLSGVVRRLCSPLNPLAPLPLRRLDLLFTTTLLYHTAFSATTHFDILQRSKEVERQFWGRVGLDATTRLSELSQIFGFSCMERAAAR